jgi:hypothetical protein
MWLWLLLALWLFSQSWAWVHRVEHGVHIQGLSTQVAASAATDPTGASALHGGTDCQWLDHALLGGLAAPASVALHLDRLAASALQQPPSVAAGARALRPYLARAPPALPAFVEGQVTG